MLHANTLFQVEIVLSYLNYWYYLSLILKFGDSKSQIPPVISIHMGSLGFLCPFSFENYPEYLDGVLKGKRENFLNEEIL